MDAFEAKQPEEEVADQALREGVAVMLIDDPRTIGVLVRQNPYRPGSRRHEVMRRVLEHEGKTVGEFYQTFREGDERSYANQTLWRAPNESRLAVLLGKKVRKKDLRARSQGCA